MEERKQNGSQRDQNNDRSLGQCRDPEGKVLIEETPPETLVLIGISRDTKIDLSRSRKLSSLLEKPLFAMNFACGVYQQVDQRGMETITGCKHLFGTNQIDLSLRNVVRKVDHAGWQRQFADKTEPSMVGFSLAVTQQLQSWIVKRCPDGMVLRSIDKDSRVNLAGLQCEQCNIVAQRLHLHIVVREAVKRENVFSQ
jgi:hypothetical protein